MRARPAVVTSFSCPSRVMCVPASAATLSKQRTRAAGGVVGGGGRFGVGRRDADGLGHDAADFGRGVELALALAALGGEVPHEILVGIAKDVVVLGAVLREIERGVLEDGDEVGELLDHLLARRRAWSDR